MILRFFERLTGQRMMYNYFVFGGVRYDIDFIDDIKQIIKILPERLDDYEKIITENPIFLSRTKGKGNLDSKTALNYSITGVNLRSSGVLYDLRNSDYLYSGLKFTPVIMQEGDSWARYKARVLEIRESIKLVSQILDYLKDTPNFEQNLVNPINLKIPEGEYYSEIEAPCTLVSNGEDRPYRLKWRTGSYYSVNLLRELLVGNYLNDAIAIAGSLDIILPEVDK
jgi:NADH-quinone oxidoreductase subunit D